MFWTQGEEAFDGQYQLVRHFLEELSISFGILTHLRTENDHYAQALTSRDQGHGAVRSKPLFDVVLLDLEFKLPSKVAPHNWLLVVKYPSVMAVFGIQRQTYVIKAARMLPDGRSHFERCILGSIKA